MDIQEATTAVDLFGPLTDDPKLRRAARRKYRLLLVELHPDKGGTKETFLKLQEFWEAWEQGKATPVKKTAAAYKVGSWEIGERIAQGTISNIYRTTDGNVVKIVRKATNTHFLQAEADALLPLQRAPHPELYPELIDHGNAGGGRDYLILPSLEMGWFTLTHVLSRWMPSRLSGADYAWMHRRLLGALAGAHQQGIVHGAVLPDNVMIHPASHGVKLIDWVFSGKPGADVPARVKTWATLYPWSTTEKTLSPEWDVYMAHAVMRWALHPAEKRQLRFAAGCTLNNPSARPTALQALTEYDDLLYSLYGKRTFRPFSI